MCNTTTQHRIRIVGCALLASASMSLATPRARADLLVADPLQGVLRFDETTGDYLGIMIYQTPRRNPPTDGQVRFAWAVTYGADNNLYIAEAAEYNLTLGLNQVSKYHGVTGALLKRGFANGGGLADPRRMAIDSDGDLWVPSIGGFAVTRYDGQTGSFVENITHPSLSGPNNVAFGPDGALYITNNADPPVLRYDLENRQFSPFVTDAYDALGPCGLAFGPDGSLYVGGILSDSVRRYDGATGASSGDVVPHAAQGLADPLSVRFGPDGNMYVISNDQELTDVGRVLRFDPSGQFIDVFVSVPGASDIRDIVFMPEFNIVAGDADNDGDVDVNDLNYVRNNFGATAGPVLGDTAPFDGDVDIEDLNAVRNNFGGEPAGVPEPSSAGLAMGAVAAMALYRRRRRKVAD